MRLDLVNLRREDVQFLVELLVHVGDLVAARVDHLIITVHFLHALVRLAQACLCHIFKVLEAELREMRLLARHIDRKETANFHWLAQRAKNQAPRIFS